MPAPLPNSPTNTPCRVRERIGTDAKSGHYPAPHRYRLHLTLASPDGLRVAITHALLGLDDVLPVTLLPAPHEAGNGRTALDAAYAATLHGHTGPGASPALTDSWTGRLVSNHVPDILADLSLRFRAPDRPALRPSALAGGIDALTLRCERGIGEAAQLAGEAGAGEAGERALETLLATLTAFDRRVAGAPFVLGDELTAADVELWVALVRLDTVHRCHLGADAVHRIADHPALWAYARRLLTHPAFGGKLRLTDLTRHHAHHCRGLEAAGAAVPIIDWTAARDALTR
ncbi:putative glutathione S-transferase [Streptomyces zhaozhouensis]|uniref:Putative glutathione S-transferase n=1 Tax=Streptomyces zhaozhouensis TaxID=1300267 RepID=A0A286DZA9_9ACTN|nr:glutathione S-transferase C-terminal domain-containing protein [Streptomyces zhaozhouensis]SOD64009.1 putative glutathione S-transferase [Streptomyces zhaozhouensis]